MRSPLVPLLLVFAAGCTQTDDIELPGSGARSLVLVKPNPVDGSDEIFAAALPAALISPNGSEPVLVFTFDRPLEELGIVPGAARLGSLTPRRSPPPAPLARYVLTGKLLEETETTTSGLALPELDLSGIFRSGRCLDPPGHVSSVCGSTVSLEGPFVQGAAGPELLDPQGRCPEGWEHQELRVDRPAPAGERVVPYCEPPARTSCGVSALQAAADASCRGSAASCPGGDFAEDLRSGPIGFVRAGAVGGDGSRALPFGSIAEAMRLGGPRVIALAKGQYAEAVVLSDEVELRGACAAETQLLGKLSLRGQRRSVRGLRVTATGTIALLVTASSDVLLDQVAIEGAVSVGDRSVATFVDARLNGPLLTVRSSEVVLRSSELNGSIAAARSTVSAEDTALTATAASSQVQVVASRLSLLRSWVGLGVLSDSASTVRAERCWLTQRTPSPTLHRNILRVSGPLELRQCTFAMPEVLVLPQQGNEPARTQFALTMDGPRLELQDALFLLARQEGSANLGAIVAANRNAEPYRLRRGLVVGGTRHVQLSINGRAEVEDWSGYDTHGNAVSAEHGDVGLARVEAARAEAALLLAAHASLEARLRDLRSFDCSTGLVLRSYGGALNADVARVHISGGRASGTGMSVRADAAAPDLAGTVHAMVREVLIDAEITRSLELGMDAVLDLRDFRFSDAGYGIELRHRARDARPPRPHHLRRGSIQADLGGVLLSDIPSELELLLDKVQVSAVPPVLGPNPP